MFVSETYEIEDCIVFDDCTTNSVESLFNVPSTLKSQSIYGFSSDGWRYGNNSSYITIYSNFTLPNLPFAVEFEVTEIYKNGLIFKVSASPSTMINVSQDGKWVLHYNGTNTSTNVTCTTAKYRWEVYSDHMVLKNLTTDTEVGRMNISAFTSAYAFDTGSSRYLRIKNFKIKPL